MSRASRALQSRWTTLVSLVTVAAMVLAAISILPAFGAPPRQECKETGVWNGEYFKQQFSGDQQPTGSPETSSNVADDAILFLSVENLTVEWTNNSDFAVFRIFEKNGKAGNDINEAGEGDGDELDSVVLPGESHSFTIVESISHITFCFTSQPEVQITKLTNNADPTSTNPNFILAGDTVTWTYDVENTGTLALANVVVTDSDSSVSPSFVSGDADGDGLLDPGEVWKYTASGTSNADNSTYDDNSTPDDTTDDTFNGYVNTGSVSADSVLDGTTVTDSDTSGYYGANPVIGLQVDEPTQPVQDGEEFKWNFTVSNDGNVPLTSNVLEEVFADKDPLQICTQDELLPGHSFTCTLTETADADDVTSTFQATGEFTDGGQVVKTVEVKSNSITLDINEAPTALDDTYTMDERDQDGPLTLTVPAPGVLGNDSDPDGDSLKATNPTTPTNGGILNSFSEDGSFSYTPSNTYVWGESESSRVDTFSYTANDNRGGTDTATVSITVVRKICEGDTVSDTDGDVTGSITLLSATGCKDWVPVVAEDDHDPNDEFLQPTILFQPEDPDETAVYDGTLTREDVSVADGSLPNVELLWDPTPEESLETDYEPMPACDIDGDGNPILSGTDTTGWCFYDLEFDLVGDQLWDVTWKVRGWDDPGFIF